MVERIKDLESLKSFLIRELQRGEYWGMEDDVVHLAQVKKELSALRRKICIETADAEKVQLWLNLR